MDIKLYAPTMPLFATSIALATLAVIGHYVKIPYVTQYDFWVVLAGYAMLALGNVMRA